MNEINLEQFLPVGSTVKGILLSRYVLPDDLPLLDQDIIEIDLPNGMTISVGWFPQQDVNGHFRVTLFRDARDQLMRPPIEVKTPFEVANSVEQFAREYTRPVLPKKAV